MALTTRTNLFPYPSAEVAGISWTIVQGSPTMGTSTAQAKYGTTSYSITVGSSTSEVRALAGTSGIPVTVGTQYTFSLYARGATTGRAITAKITWYNAAGTLLSTSAGSAVGMSTANYDVRPYVTATAPANAAFAAIQILVSGAGAGEVSYFDGLLFEAADAPGGYFDGSFTATADYAYAWSGPVGQSSSTESKLRRKNYLVNPSVEGAATNDWAASVPIASDVTKAHSRTASGTMTSGGASCYVVAPANGFAELAALERGQVFTGSAWVYTETANITATAALDRTSSLVSGTAVALTPGVWTRVSVTGRYSNLDATPTNARRLRITFAGTGMVSGVKVWVDDALLEQSPTLDPYFDGASTSGSGWTYGWTGEPDNSTSYASPGSAAPTLSQTYTAALSYDASGVHQHTLAQTYSLGLSVASSGVPSGPRTLSQTYSLSLSQAVSGVHQHSLSQTYGLALGVTADGSVPGSHRLTQTYKLALSYLSRGHRPPRLTQTYSYEPVYLAEFYREKLPTPLDEQPLTKLKDFTVHSSATPLDPSQGTGGVPSVSATFLRGKRPESAMGAQATVRNGAVGTWTGEVTRLSLPQKSERAPVTIDTALTRLNKDMRLFPHMPAAASTTTAAEAVDYWTQSAGLHYDRIEGDVAFYASGYGHAFAYGLAQKKLYEKSYTAATVGGRRMLAYGPASLCTVHEVKKDAKKPFIPVAVTAHRKIALGSGFAGTGNGTSEFLFEDGHTLALSVSGTAVSVSYNGQSLATATLAGSGWAWASLEKIGTSVWAVRITADATSPVQLPSIALPASLRLTGVRHTGDATRYRYGTFLSVAEAHPVAAPSVQKDLRETSKPLDFASGFEGNVWDMLNQFCAVNELDLSFADEKLTLAPRSNALTNVPSFGDLTPTFERREKYRQVAVMDQRSKASRTPDALLWRSDSVYQVAAREVFETTITTEHSILSLAQPVCVTGIEPFPYKTGTGQYVVTGADGYIISPAWWADNGGKVEVELTDKEGEFLLRIIAPTVDTVRAPYRLSEGQGDRPALYVCGSGIVNDPKEVHVSTGAANAREGFDSVFDSPFCSGPAQVYGTAMAMAAKYSAGYCEYEVAVDGQWGEPTAFGVYASGAVFSAGNRAVRLMDAQQEKSGVSGTGHAHTTVGMVRAFFPDRLVGERPNRTIREASISPLERN